MKYLLMIRSRPDPGEGVAAKHERVMSSLRALPAPWGVVSPTWPKARDPVGDYSEILQFKGCFGKGIRTEMHYFRRDDLRDEAFSDDFILMEFDPTRLDYAALFDALPAYVETFRPYLIELREDAWYDAEVEKMGRVKMRHGVYALGPVNYFDRELCHRAFSLTPEEVVARLAGHAAEARVLRDGAYVLATRGLVDEVRYREIDARLRPLLRGA